MKKWFTMSMGEALLLSLQFSCEIGMVQLSSDESMEALFGSMEAERVYSIRGELLACRIIPVK